MNHQSHWACAGLQRAVVIPSDEPTRPFVAFPFKSTEHGVTRKELRTSRVCDRTAEPVLPQV